jgi:hypothetical protein
MKRLSFFASHLLSLTLALGCSKSTEEPPASGATPGTPEKWPGATQPASSTKGNPIACAACEKERCSQFAGACGKLEGVAAEGPRQGTKKSVLCEETTACIKQSQCAAKEFHDCYCGGSSSDPMSCLGGKATGACRAQLEASLETADPGQVALRFVKREYAGGNALAPMVCRREACDAECSGVPY